MNTDADLKAWCAAHGINVILHDGRLSLDGEAMRRMADHAPDPDRAHAVLDRLFTETVEHDQP
jgi:hypothetical protein